MTAATADVAEHLRVFLAFDYGTKRVGCAVGNRLLRTATPQRSAVCADEARWAWVAARIHEWCPDALVVGVPFHPDGAAHDNTRRARGFAEQLRNRYRLPVFEADERYTTTEALSQGATDLDSAAAAIFLEQFLRGLP
ncbi:Holliday junction resolvase RuvX [Candidatus Symbiobacter mobilis]|uniref:Putative pre-16S rRNA nuclease n=1 Tax=Candidatus Symbiobacter mobilis CR TaxID=946483 RepID=U5N878_9BURK|nr:Holliday junction resolvase RuvX [Candidatus Symbiobacter mobilis]AGX87607.1 holliday junction resolvase-like protein [Candidatus Symbiobacter mobilis CR]